MKDYIRSLISRDDHYNVNLRRIREYLQEYFLYILYKKKFYVDVVFCGGTALRFLYNVKRFSEDLDFSLSTRTKKFDFSAFVAEMTKELNAAGYNIKVREKKGVNAAVAGAFFKFPGLLFENELTPHKDEVISVKLEIDLNPPRGGKEETTPLNKNFIFYSRHYDLASLLSGKLHAILRRKYTKGRDWYDLYWYLTKFKGLEPNYIMLNNALKQDSMDALAISSDNFSAELRNVVENADFAYIRRDIAPFLEFPEEASALNKKTFLKIIP